MFTPGLCALYVVDSYPGFPALGCLKQNFWKVKQVIRTRLFPLFRGRNLPYVIYLKCTNLTSYVQTQKVWKSFLCWLPDLTAAASLPGCQAERIPLTLVVGKRGNWWRPPTAASLLAAFVMSSPTSLGKQFVDLCPTPTCSTGMKLSTISLKSQVVP